MSLRLVLLSAGTLRAQGYARVLSRHTEHDVTLIEYGGREVFKYAFPPLDSRKWYPLGHELQSDWLSDYSKLAASASAHKVSSDLNSPEVADVLAQASPDVVVYAGAAGQLVSPELLRVAPFLHIHPGRLPEYRGSTTIYWSLLRREPVYCTALYLSEQIDQGLWVAEQQFPNPIRACDVDHLYDAGIRASLLDSVLRDNSEIPVGQTQSAGGRDHYVIHPVLKNLVLMGLSEGAT